MKTSDEAAATPAASPAVVSEKLLSNSFLGNLVEVSIATRDHRRTMEGLLRLGIGPWRVYTLDQSTVKEQTYAGKPAEWGLKVCFADAANVIWEIMAPIHGPTIVQDFLDTHGEGIHHIAFDCNDMPFEQRIKSFASRGFPVTMSGRVDASAFSFFDTEGATTTTFETYVFPPDFEMPEPDEWFPAPPPQQAAEE